MGIIKKLFGNKTASEGPEVTDEEVAALVALLGDKRDEEALETGQALLKRPLSAERGETVRRTVGLALFQLGDFSKALGYLEPLCVENLDPGAHFNLASCAIMAGKVDRGLSALKKALELFPEHGDNSIPPPPYMMFFIMQALLGRKAFPQAFEILQDLFSIYAGCRNTDSTFLELRGVPALRDTLNKALPLFFHPDAATALMELRSSLDENGQALIDSLVEHLKQASKWPL